jgi:hypothetical protein
MTIREYIEKKYETLESTISANLAIPPGIGGTPSNFSTPPRIHRIDTDPEVDDTDDEDRGGDTGVQPASGTEKKQNSVI